MLQVGPGLVEPSVASHKAGSRLPWAGAQAEASAARKAKALAWAARWGRPAGRASHGKSGAAGHCASEGKGLELGT